MYNRVLTIISTLMIFIPWTILLLRNNNWALESPAAEIIIGSYAVFMIFSGIFTVFLYMKMQVRNNWVRICMVINCLYAVAGICALVMMIVGRIS